MLCFTFTLFPCLSRYGNADEYIYVRLFFHQDNSCAKESHKVGTSDSDLDLELDSLRRKLESVSTLVVMILWYIDFCNN